MLRQIHVRGLWSLADVTLDLEDLNVVLGANGSGKSSLLNTFRLLRAITGRGLARFVQEMGGASSVLHYGPKVTPHAVIELEFDGTKGCNAYRATLTWVADDRLVFAEEKVRFTPEGGPSREFVVGPGAHPESYLGLALQAPDAATPTVRYVKWHLDRFCHYHFHDTSSTAGLRRTSDVDDTAYLQPDGSNLAAFLLALREHEPEAYAHIRANVGRAFVEFDDFVLERVGPPPGKVKLRWRERGNAYEFGPHQLSDGTLRFIALATLLLQPGSPHDKTHPNFPLLILIDEPELGLHPVAVGLVGEMLRLSRAQRIVATQSVEMVSHLVADETELSRLVLVNREQSGSRLERASGEKLKPWLESYSPAELWTHGLLGALP